MNGCLTCHNNAMIVTDGNNRFSNQSTAYNFAVARSNAGNPDGSMFLVKVSGGAKPRRRRAMAIRFCRL